MNATRMSTDERLLASGPRTAGPQTTGLQADGTGSAGRNGGGVSGQAGPGDVMMNKRELAARLKITVRTVENWQRRGFLPYLKISKVVLFHWPEVVEHLKAHFRVCRRGVLRPGR